jgi:beta-glucosidase
MHELYLWPFQDAVHAGVGSVMCSYQRLNSTYGCDNSKSLNGLLKGELGFQGFVVSDWTAQMSGISSANAGLDMVMPDRGHWRGSVLTDSAREAYGQARLNDMATRILAAWYKINMDSPKFPVKGTGMTADILRPHHLVDARDKASKSTRFQAAVEGHVLVKNVDNTLPLVQPKLLSLFGYDGVATLVNNQDPILNVPGVSLTRWIGGFQALNLTDFQLGLSLLGASPMPNSARKGNLFSGGGSGSGTPSYIDAPFNAIQQRAINDDTYLLWDFQSLNPNVNPASTACMVFINEFATEGIDRPSLADPVSDGLVRNVANKCNSTIVVIHNAGIRLVDAWIDHPNITAVIFAHLPGQDSGRALVEIMYGDQSPSGRLPYTLAKKEADYGQLAAPSTSVFNYNPQSTPPISNLMTKLLLTSSSGSFTEGVNIDYRWFLSKRIEPQYPLGYGLSYSTFKYSNLQIVQLSTLTPKLDTSAFPPPQAVGEGGNPNLWQPIAYIECRLENVGKVNASEVAQLYLQLPGPDVETRQLRGFVKKKLAKGVAGLVHFNLTRRDLSIWNVSRQDWEMRRGEYKVFVGSSVLDIKLTGTFSISDAKTGAVAV